VRALLTYILLICFSLSLTAQPDTTITALQHIDTDTYRKLRKEVIYEKNTSKLLPKKVEPSEPKKRKKEDIKTDNLNFLSGPLATMIGYALIAILVLLIIWVLLSNVKLGDKETEVTVIETDEDDIENIEEVDTDAGYHDALAAGDYRLACRMIFLKVLQKLEAQEKIRWKKEKTNRHYIHELAGDEWAPLFRSLVLTYEQVWYGDKYIDKDKLTRYAEEAGQIIPLKLPSHE